MYTESSPKALSTSPQEKDRHEEKKQTTKEANFDNFIRKEHFTINRKRIHKMASIGFTHEEKLSHCSK